IDLYYFFNRLDATSEKGDIFISDAGSSYYVAGQALRFEKGQREITSGAFAAMGLSIPLAIGAAVKDKDSLILAVTGDGSLELNIQELKTMSVYGLNIKLFVINNGGYVSIRNTQDKLFDGRYICSDQKGSDMMLDFSKIAQAFCLPYYLINDYKDIDKKINEIKSSKGPAFVEVVCDSNQKIYDPGKGMK
ncbi:MAG: thiamine pyrophosphate-dependent enzyme, partial [Candidatus Margulisiibacteriota bacterium]